MDIKIRGEVIVLVRLFAQIGGDEDVMSNGLERLIDLELQKISAAVPNFKLLPGALTYKDLKTGKTVGWEYIPKPADNEITVEPLKKSSAGGKHGKKVRRKAKARIS